MEIFHLEKVAKEKLKGQEVLPGLPVSFRGWAGNSEVEGQRL